MASDRNNCLFMMLRSQKVNRRGSSSRARRANGLGAGGAGGVLRRERGGGALAAP